MEANSVGFSYLWNIWNGTVDSAGPQRAQLRSLRGQRLVLGNIAEFVQRLMQARKTVPRGSTGRICVTIPPAYVCVSEEVG